MEFNEEQKFDVVGVVTTARGKKTLSTKARETAARIGIEFFNRQGQSLEKIRQEAGARAVYVETDDAPYIHTPAGALYYHENTAGIRTKNGKFDPISKALETRPGDCILDATFGLGTDALVYACRLEDGSVTGLESNPLLADILARGFANYKYSHPRLTAAAGRISILNADYNEYLKNCGTDSFDTIYFDPMFEQTISASPSMSRLKYIADYGRLTNEALAEAIRVARRRVVVKGRRGYFNDLKFDSIAPGGHTIFYGIIE